MHAAEISSSPPPAHAAGGANSRRRTTPSSVLRIADEDELIVDFAIDVPAAPPHHSSRWWVRRSIPKRLAGRKLALGLRWADVDLDSGKVSIHQTVSAVGHELRLEPRTKSGKPRPIEIDKTTRRRAARRAGPPKRRSVCGSALASTTMIWCSPAPTAGPSAPSSSPTPSSAVSPLHHLPRMRLHALRHTWATLALAAGVDVKILSERLGHASAKITWDIFSRVTPTMQADAAETVARL